MNIEEKIRELAALLNSHAAEQEAQIAELVATNKQLRAMIPNQDKPAKPKNARDVEVDNLQVGESLYRFGEAARNRLKSLASSRHRNGSNKRFVVRTMAGGAKMYRVE